MTADLAAQYQKALAEAEAAWQGGPRGEDPPPAITAAARVYGLDPDRLRNYVEGICGWEPHDEGYAETVRESAERLKVLDGG